MAGPPTRGVGDCRDDRCRLSLDEAACMVDAGPDTDRHIARDGGGDSSEKKADQPLPRPFPRLEQPAYPGRLPVRLRHAHPSVAASPRVQPFARGANTPPTNNRAGRRDLRRLYASRHASTPILVLAQRGEPPFLTIVDTPRKSRPPSPVTHQGGCPNATKTANGLYALRTGQRLDAGQTIIRSQE